MTATLTLQNGDVLEEVTLRSLVAAVDDLLTGAINANILGTPNIWLSLEIDQGNDWVEHSLGYFRDGRLIYTVYDNEQAIEPTFEVQTIMARDEALELLTHLLNGNHQAVKAHEWELTS